MTRPRCVQERADLLAMADFLCHRFVVEFCHPGISADDAVFDPFPGLVTLLITP